MSSPRTLGWAKAIALIGFLALLCSTYYLRSEVLTLNRIGFSAEQLRAEYELERLKENYPHEVERYDVAKKNYELQVKHYEEMLSLYQTDYNAYVKRIEDEYKPPQLPNRPQMPASPQYNQKLSEINAAFRTQKYHYFQMTSMLNWIALAAALCLVGGLLYLLLFDTANGRLIYFFTLVLSFVFMIGPSFHSILSAIVGFMRAPGMY